jgi:hypothetical protein
MWTSSRSPMAGPAWRPLQGIQRGRPTRRVDLEPVRKLTHGYDFPIDRRVGRGLGLHGSYRQEGSGPVEAEEDSRLQGEEVGCREDKFVDEPVQKASHQVGGAEQELRRHATLCVCVDNMASSWNREGILFGLALRYHLTLTRGLTTSHSPTR